MAGPVRYPVVGAHAGIRLHPGWAGVVLGCPVAGVESGMPLVDVRRSSSVRRAEDELAAAHPDEARAALARLVLDEVGSWPDRRVLAAARRLARGDDSVPAVAAGVGRGERRLRRLFDHHVGLSPKAFHGVARSGTLSGGWGPAAARARWRSWPPSAATTTRPTSSGSAGGWPA